MNTPYQSLKHVLNKAYLKEKVARTDVDRLKKNLRRLWERVDVEESEANLRDHLRDFLNDTWYSDKHLVAAKGRTDLVIHIDKHAKSDAAVLFEVKRPKNAAEMCTLLDINKKALQELVWYYLKERVDGENRSIKKLIITDVKTWFIFDENDFEQHIYHNKKLQQYYQHVRVNDQNTDVVYKTIGKDFLSQIIDKLPFTYFELNQYIKPAFDEDASNDRLLIPLYKGLSPVHLLQLSFANDSNSLDKPFYNELLHLIGLEEVKDKGKKLIQRKAVGQRYAGSLLENTISTLQTEDSLRRLPQVQQYGQDHDERLFHVGLELVITWINRLLFLKLLESQLAAYHQQDDSYKFLHFGRITDFDELNELFFDVLARKASQRPDVAKEKYAKIPYLNSSLFEITDIESGTVRINSLKDRLTLPVLSQTVLKDQQGKKRSGEMRTLEYLFQFLDAYDFSSEGSEDISEESKTLINASVLGLIFEKINGYRDGSFFTPGFITMYMCRETIRRAAVQQFNERYGWQCQDAGDLKNYLMDKRGREEVLEANTVVNSLKICDPAVGSGHFLVSALNELIALKSELGILADANGVRLPVEAKVENDELTIIDENGLYSYRLVSSKAQAENARIQQTLFVEKRTIIEQCLFGVDINPNSVKICRLRLWIELLKNAYYKADGELETLPNIDINIKQGNSLVSRFALDTDLSKALKSVKYDINTYKQYVSDYHEATDKDFKHGLLHLINQIKQDFRIEIRNNDPLIKQKNKIGGELYNMMQQGQLFGLTEAEAKDRDKKVAKAKTELEKIESQIAEIQSNKLYESAFEWRFEFPEVLDSEGRFIGFDVIVGNPPYIRQEELTEFKSYFSQQYSQTFAGTADLYVYFVERGMSVLRRGGQFSYILPNKWMRAGYGDRLRRFIKSVELVGISDFGDLPVFEEATTYPCVLELRQAEPHPTFRATAIKTLDFEQGLATYLQKEGFAVNLESLQDSGWSLTNQAVQQLLEKMRQTGTPLGEYVNGQIFYGIKTGLNEAFVIDTATRDALIAADPRSAEVIKPFLAGRDVKRYQVPASERFLVFTRRGIEIEEYPAVLAHLEQFKDALMPQPKDWKPKNSSDKWPGRKQGSYKWYEIQDSVDYYKEFEREKIIYPNILKAPEFTLDDGTYYTNQKCFIIPRKDLFLLGYLNSSVNFFLFKQILPKLRGDFFEPSSIFFDKFPIPPATATEREAIETLVEQVLQAKAADGLSDTTELESAIDVLVYGLFGLSEEEIGLVVG